MESRHPILNAVIELLKADDMTSMQSHWQRAKSILINFAGFQA